ncbi:hypothetical protein [Capybara microvirus Cap3_SP_475]|nr:hypothetical protein [Capybara microvirus Cap3_SP_475]
MKTIKEYINFKRQAPFYLDCQMTIPGQIPSDGELFKQFLGNSENKSPLLNNLGVNPSVYQSQLGDVNIDNVIPECKLANTWEEFFNLKRNAASEVLNYQTLQNYKALKDKQKLQNSSIGNNTNNNNLSEPSKEG